MSEVVVFIIGVIFIYLGSVVAEVVISPVNATALENGPVTMTCTLSETTESVLFFSWYIQLNSQTSVIPVGILNSTCKGVIVPINTSLYDYTCPTSWKTTWTIKKVTRENHGDRYQCTIATSSGSGSSGFTFVDVQVPVSVNMTVPSSESVNLSENTTVQFQCQTSRGRPEATVTWYKDSGTPENTSDDIEIASNIQTSSSTYNGMIAVTSILRYSSSRSDNGWRIYCTAINVNGQTSSVSQRKPQLNVLYPPTLPTFSYWNTSGPSLPTNSLDVIKGDTFQIACSSTGNPEPNYQWNNSGTNQILTVTSITADRSYVCIARNTMVETVGETRHGSASATLKINVQYPPFSVTIKYQYDQGSETTLNTSLSVIEGNPLRVICGGKSKPEPSYRWSGTISSSSATLQINRVRRSQSGTLTCVVENIMIRTFANPEKQHIGRINRSFDLHILYPPVIGELKNTTVVEGSPVTVSCPVTVGNPPKTTFEWKRNGQVWMRTQSWTIDTIFRSDATLYTCMVLNIMQQTAEQPLSRPDTKSFYLNVLYSASVTEFYIDGHREETSVTVNETDTVLFKCMADSNPGSTLSIVYMQDVRYLQTNTKSLDYSIRSAQCTDTGVYICEGFNQFNVEHSTRSLNLYVNCSPRPSPYARLMQNITSAQYQPVILTFTALAYPEPEVNDYKWYRWNGSVWLYVTDNEDFTVDTSHLQTNLTVTSVYRSFFGMYKIMVKNLFGQYEHTFHLLPEDVPEQPSGFRHIAELVTQSSVTVEWTPGFSNGLFQTFLVKYKKVSNEDWMTVAIPDTKQLTMNYTIHGLTSGTQYLIVLHAINKLGNSTETEVLTITTKADDATSSSVVGVAVGVSVTVIAVVTVAVGLFMARRHLKKEKLTDGKLSHASNNDYMDLHPRKIYVNTDQVYDMLQGQEHQKVDDSKLYENLKM